MPGVNSLDVIVSVINESEPRSGGSPVATGVKPVDPHCQAVERQRRDRR